MNQEIQDLWLNALEDGNYQQGRNQLVRETKDGGDEYCCLGVLCDLHVKAGGLERRQNFFHPKRGDGISPYGAFSMPDESTLEWAGISREQAATLAGMNDHGAPFGAIACVIRDLL